MNSKADYAEICAAYDVPIFMQHWWLDATGYDWDVAVSKNGNAVAGIWPYMIEQKAGIQISRNPALTPYLGPHVFYPADLKESKRDNFQHQVITDLLSQLPPLKVWSCAAWPGLHQVGLFQASGFDVRVRQTFIMDLSGGDEAAINLRLHEDFRRNLRKSATELTIADEPEMLPQLYAFQKATLERKELRMYYPESYIQRLFDATYQRGQSALWVARKDGDVQAILWNIWDGTRAYYLVGSRKPGIRDNRAVTALIWHSIKHALAAKKVNFDFEGSMDPGVEHFFRNFGAGRNIYLTLSKNQSLLWKMIKMVRR